ncbi:Uncharacterised protein [Legionella pneumophila]|nr:Uncharacterised protein [Legionella pneumophila]
MNQYIILTLLSIHAISRKKHPMRDKEDNQIKKKYLLVKHYGSQGETEH